MEDRELIEQTVSWIQKVVVGCNFCPFAAKAVLRKSIRYQVHRQAGTARVLEAFRQELAYLDNHSDAETAFLILPENFNDFDAYLDLVAEAEELLEKTGYSGVYQVASFHPDYCFEGADTDDPANYTNRSVYPMLHLLREESISLALEHFKNPEAIPDRNMEFARSKGLHYMQVLRAACL